MRAGQAMVLPLLQLKEFDQYTTTHSINVAVLTMGLAEFLGLGTGTGARLRPRGTAARSGEDPDPAGDPDQAGKLTPEERTIVEAHPADGARMILEGEEQLDMAAAVAYEHHLCVDGRGYPEAPLSPGGAVRQPSGARMRRLRRAAHQRPYRDAWSSGEALEYIRGRAGSEFDPDAVGAFLNMMQSWDDRIAVQQG